MRFSKFGRDGHGHDDGDVDPHFGGQFWHHHFDAPCSSDPPRPTARIEYRSFDGSGNNLADATLNAAGPMRSNSVPAIPTSPTPKACRPSCMRGGNSSTMT
jgi:hypothetical protein